MSTIHVKITRLLVSFFSNTISLVWDTYRGLTAIIFVKNILLVLTFFLFFLILSVSIKVTLK